jgi:hypothetical protein
MNYIENVFQQLRHVIENRSSSCMHLNFNCFEMRYILWSTWNIKVNKYTTATLHLQPVKTGTNFSTCCFDGYANFGISYIFSWTSKGLFRMCVTAAGGCSFSVAVGPLECFGEYASPLSTAPGPVLFSRSNSRPRYDIFYPIVTGKFSCSSPRHHSLPSALLLIFSILIY